MAKVNPKPFKFWITVTEIMKQLREIVQTREHRPHAAHETLSITRDLPVVVTKRQTGKTIGLVYFVGERTLLLPDANLCVIVPNEDIGVEFIYQFNTHFPMLKAPTLISIGDAMSRLRGNKFHEIYVEEVFLIQTELLFEVCASYPVIAGVGTIELPTTIRV